MKPYYKYKTLQQYANAIARAMGSNKATEIVMLPVGESPKVISRTYCGYRKYTTGEYVAKKYLANFGWKNTYYQSAACVVGVPQDEAIYLQLKEG